MGGVFCVQQQADLTKYKDLNMKYNQKSNITNCVSKEGIKPRLTSIQSEFTV